MTDQQGWGPPQQPYRRPPWQQPSEAPPGQQQPPWDQGQQPYGGPQHYPGQPQQPGSSYGTATPTSPAGYQQPPPGNGYQPPQQGHPAGHRARQPTPRRRKSNKIILMSFGGILLSLVLIAVVGTALGAGKPKKTADTKPHPAVTSAATTAPEPTAAPTTPSVSQQLQSWLSNGGQSAINAIVTDLGAIQSDGDAENFSAVASDCQALSTAVTNLQAVGPLPYPPAERPLARALAHYSEAASACVAGASTENAQQIAQATTDMTEGDTFLGRATAAIKNLGG